MVRVISHSYSIPTKRKGDAVYEKACHTGRPDVVVVTTWLAMQKIRQPPNASYLQGLKGSCETNPLVLKHREAWQLPWVVEVES